LEGNLIVAAELAFQNAIHPAGALLGAQLARKVRFAAGAAAAAAATTTPAGRTAMLAGSEIPLLDRALRRITALAFQK
jgi:hypothetical protein